MDSQFLNLLIQKHSLTNVEIYIADTNSRIIASNQEQRIGEIGNTARYIQSILHAASIQSNQPELKAIIYHGIPVFFKDSLVYIVVVKGKEELVSPIATSLKEMIQATLEYEDYTKKKHMMPNDEREILASQLLTEPMDVEKLTSMMYQQEFDPHLPRSVIYIHLKFHQNSYFNINLSLGYESSIEQLRTSIIREVRANKYLNSQDLTYAPNRNTILIIKSFLLTNDISRVYTAMEQICFELSKSLNQFHAVSYSIAYGDFTTKIENLPRSLSEASEIIDLGTMSGRTGFFRLDSLYLNYMVAHITPLVLNQLILPTLEKLSIDHCEANQQLLDTAEVFVDSSMNLTTAAKQLCIHRNTVNARLAKFESITGLYPSHSFKDAFLIKIAAIYLRQKKQKETLKKGVNDEYTKYE